MVQTCCDGTSYLVVVFLKMSLLFLLAVKLEQILTTNDAAKQSASAGWRLINIVNDHFLWRQREHHLLTHIFSSVCQHLAPHHTFVSPCLHLCVYTVQFVRASVRVRSHVSLASIKKFKKRGESAGRQRWISFNVIS